MLTDRFGRTIKYMRISVTDRCNLRCRYCMPDGIRCVSMQEILSYEEIAFVCARAAELGIDRFRITGGEPLVRKDCAELAGMLKRIPGIRQVTMTTNGVLLGEYWKDLTDAGIDAVNISLNTLNREQYRNMTGTDELEKVFASVRLAAGKVPVKINCVILKGINDDAPEQLATLARDLPVDVRFIEMMPIGAGKNWETVPGSEILDRIEKRFGKTEEDPATHGNGPAVYRSVNGFAGKIGFISAVHGKFCGTCNRLRLTSTGELKPCLCYDDAIPIRDILRDPDRGKEERIREAIREAVRRKPQAHCFESREGVTERRKMSQIGG